MTFFSSLASRLRSSARPLYSNLQWELPYRRMIRHSTTEQVLISDSKHSSRMPWASSLLPIALVVSAGTLAFHAQSNLSLCQAHIGDPSFGGNGSTDYLVNGEHKNVPQELFDELKVICQENMTIDYDERSDHGKPHNSFHKAVNIPDVIVFPRSEKEVSDIVKCCNKHKLTQCARLILNEFEFAHRVFGHELSKES